MAQPGAEAYEDTRGERATFPGEPDALPRTVTPQVATRYRIHGCLGEGGMGNVFVASDTLLDRRVAIKSLRSEIARHPDAVERFVNEARILARLRGQNIAHILDVGTTHAGVPYMVLEYLDGYDLAQLVHNRGPLPVSEAVDFVLQACRGLAEAHALGIVHRDLKPENLFVTTTPDGRPVVKVIDFGISKRPATRRRSLTDPRTTIGSPNYMAPEQMTNPSQVDARADIWSLGATLYYLLTAELPFDGESISQVFANVLKGDPLRPDLMRPDTPPAVTAAIHRCVARDASERFSDVAELAATLVAFAELEDGAAEDCRKILENARHCGVKPTASLPPPYSGLRRKPRDVHSAQSGPRDGGNDFGTVAAAGDVANDASSGAIANGGIADGGIGNGGIGNGGTADGCSTDDGVASGIVTDSRRITQPTSKPPADTQPRTSISLTGLAAALCMLTAGASTLATASPSWRQSWSGLGTETKAWLGVGVFAPAASQVLANEEVRRESAANDTLAFVPTLAFAPTWVRGAYPSECESAARRDAQGLCNGAVREVAKETDGAKIAALAPGHAFSRATRPRRTHPSWVANDTMPLENAGAPATKSALGDLGSLQPRSLNSAPMSDSTLPVIPTASAVGAPNVPSASTETSM